MLAISADAGKLKRDASACLRKMLKTGFGPFFQERDELRIAALILIGDVQRDDAVVGGALLVLLSDPLAVMRLHREDQIGAGNKLFGQRPWRVGIRSGRKHLEARQALEQVFGGRASQLVGGADE